MTPVREVRKPEDKKRGWPGRKTTPGDRCQFLAVMDASVTKAIKVAEEEETTAAELHEREALGLFERRKTTRFRKA